MAPNSRIAKPCPGRVGMVVSTSKNAISDLSSAISVLGRGICWEWLDEKLGAKLSMYADVE